LGYRGFLLSEEMVSKHRTRPLDFDNHIANFVKCSRAKAKMTQEDLAEKAGVGLRFIRHLEQSKKTLRLYKVNQVLQLFGFILSPAPQRKKDAFEILRNLFNRNVNVHLKNRNPLVGFLIEPIYTYNEITAWRFISNNNAREYQETKKPELG
jgi:y4mF family transcriptional regulator